MKSKKSNIGLLAGVMLAVVSIVFAGSVYEGASIDRATSKVEVVKSEISNAADHFIASVKGNEAGVFTAFVVALIAVPAIASMRFNGSLGFNKQRVYVAELNQYLSYAGKALWDYLTAEGSDADIQTKNDLVTGRLRIRSFNASIKSIITSLSGIQEVFNPSIAIQRQGRIPEILNQARLPKGTNAAISHIGLAYATDATATVPEADVDYSRVVTAWPNALANGETIFKQDGILERVENKFAGSQANSFQSGVESDGYELEQPMLWKEDRVLTIEQRFAAGQAISGTNNHFLDICVIGAIVTRKG